MADRGRRRQWRPRPRHFVRSTIRLGGMPNLRLALCQTDPWVGDIARNGDEVVRWTRQAVEAGAQLVAFPEMALTGYPVEDLALRRSFVEASRSGLAELAGRLAAAGLGEVPVVVGYLGRSEQPSPRFGPAGRLPAELRRGAVPRRGRHPVRQAPPAELRRVRRVPLVRPRRPAAGGAGARGGRRAGDLRGHLAGRRPGDRRPRGRGGPAAGDQRLAVRAQQGRRPAGAGAAPGRRGRLRARLREHGRRPGRAGLRRRLDRGRPGRRGAGPLAAVRGAPAGAGPRPGRPPAATTPTGCCSPTACTWSAPSWAAGAPTRPPRRSAPRSRRGSPTRPRSGPRWSPAPGPTCARTASARC